MYTDFLTAKNYRVITAVDGADAIAQVQAHRPDLVLMDIQMPNVDGMVAIQHIRAEPTVAKTPIIALTALAMTGDRERCMAAGADGYLSKPVSLRNLDAKVREMLKREA
jgi:CheY-like chemotaxis protein